MAKFNVRIDVRFDLEVEADDGDEACERAEAIFDPDTDPFTITEILAFEKHCNHDWGGEPSLGAECLVCGAQCEDEE